MIRRSRFQKTDGRFAFRILVAFGDHGQRVNRRDIAGQRRGFLQTVNRPIPEGGLRRHSRQSFNGFLIAIFGGGFERKKHSGWQNVRFRRMQQRFQCLLVSHAGGFAQRVNGESLQIVEVNGPQQSLHRIVVALAGARAQIVKSLAEGAEFITLVALGGAANRRRPAKRVRLIECVEFSVGGGLRQLRNG